MSSEDERRLSRRRFLQYLAASALLCGVIRRDAWAAVAEAAPADLHALITDPGQALNVFDFEPVARHVLPPAHWGYLATGVYDDATRDENHAAYQRIRLRPRRLVDVSRIDAGVELFGQRWDTPIALAPAGSQKAFHSEGEIAVAKAARARGHLQILSSVTNSSVEDVTAARGAPIWYQLYPTSRWDITQKLVRRAENAGCPVVVLTVDLTVAPGRETVKRWARLDERDCSQCHGSGPDAFFERRPMYDGTGIKSMEEFAALSLTWPFIERLKAETSMRVVIKGIATREDAVRCLENGADGIIVSNHGGRAEESGMATIDSLPEVVAAVDGRVPVLVDGGIRRGSDVYKALALGADAVCIGRPYLWGLGAFGQPGVDRVLALLRAELEDLMSQMGTPAIADIGPDAVVV
jgi:isopentenyl diphosphate isomerase/L-lactate dehydrogenase-like FMN-dependent dehydrogenase